MKVIVANLARPWKYIRVGAKVIVMGVHSHGDKDLRVEVLVHSRGGRRITCWLAAKDLCRPRISNMPDTVPFLTRCWANVDLYPDLVEQIKSDIERAHARKVA